MSTALAAGAAAVVANAARAKATALWGIVFFKGYPPVFPAGHGTELTVHNPTVGLPPLKILNPRRKQPTGVNTLSGLFDPKEKQTLTRTLLDSLPKEQPDKRHKNCPSPRRGKVGAISTRVSTR